MEFHVTPLRAAALIVLIAGFVLLAVLAPEAAHVAGPGTQRAMGRAIGSAAMTFLAGAVAATLVEHRVGLIDRVNLRYVYIILGVAGMGFGVFLLLTARGHLGLTG